MMPLFCEHRYYT